MTVIVNCSMKGGTGKTTESIMLANCFAARGKKGCFIDLDTNNSGTMYYMSGIADSFEKQNAFEMFVHRNVMDNLIETRIKNISIVPSSLSLNDVRIEGGALKKALTKDNLDFDFIIIDTAPAYTDVTINALAAADIIFTPIQPQVFNLTTSEYLRTKLVEEFPEQVPKWYLIYSFWRDAVVMAKERRVVGGGESNDARYFLTSLENIETVKKAIRRHWGIERRLHWCLDVFFGEDGKRHRKDHCPENMTVMRRIALNLLRSPEKPENKKKDNLSKRKVWFRANRKFREAVLRQL